MPLQSDDLWTVERVQALPADGNKYELVWGELLVSPSPRRVHQRVVRRLDQLIGAYCEAHHLGEVFGVAADISWSADTLVQPDVFVIAKDVPRDAEWKEVKRLEFVAEILSPGNAKHDRFQKRKLYQSQGIGTVWLVDAEKHFVEVWTSDAIFPTRETERVRWHPEGASAPLVIELAELFS